MHFLVQLIEEFGLALVFLNVLIEQMGTPLPAYPTLVVTGALLGRGSFSAPTLLLVAVAAALIADFMWYLAGRRYGRRIMGRLCRISFTPDSCVSQTERIYLRWGAPSLIVAKFIPGFASIASGLAGALGTSRTRFALFDGLGAMIWAGSAIFLGSLFSSTIDDLLSVLESLGKWGVGLLGLAMLIFLGRKWWQRQQFLKSLYMDRISVDELNQLLQNGEPPIIFDVRPKLSDDEKRIPGAIMVPIEGPFPLQGKPTDGEVVIYCACPNEASSAVAAKRIMKQGYRNVRPLEGGIDAWMDAGYSVEP